MDASFEGFVTAISSAHKEITRIKTNEMRRFGLKGTDVMVLYHLEQASEGVTASELARHIGVDRAMVSRSLVGLEHEGFVEVPHGTGRYKALIRLTEAGAMVSEELNEIIEKSVAKAVDGISEKDRATMRNTLNQIVENLRTL